MRFTLLILIRGVVTGMQMIAVRPNRLAESATPCAGKARVNQRGRKMRRVQHLLRAVLLEPRRLLKCEDVIAHLSDFHGPGTCAWFPAEAVTTPAAASSGSICAMRL